MDRCVPLRRSQARTLARRYRNSTRLQWCDGRNGRWTAVYHCDEVRLGLLLGDTGIALNCDCVTVGTNVGLLCSAATGQVGWGYLGETKGGAALDCDCSIAGTDIGLLYQCNEAWLRLLLGDTGIALNCDCATVGTDIRRVRMGLSRRNLGRSGRTRLR